MKSFSPPRWFRNISIAYKLYFIVGVMALLIAMELFTLWFSIKTLSSIRAYVSGEGLWSKAQKNSIYNLRKFVSTGNEEDYREYLNFFKVPIGDRKARIEMGKKNPDYDLLHRSFLQGGNHPDDIDGMIKLFRRFHTISYLHKAINIWIEGDKLLDELHKSANELHTIILAHGISSPEKVKQELNNIDQYNIKLTLLEDQFSAALGEGSRWLENLVLNILLTIALTVEISGLLLTLSVSRNISKGINKIIKASRQVAEGNLKAKTVVDSEDEIGQLARSFNKMTDDLEQNTIHLTKTEEELISKEKYITSNQERINEIVDVLLKFTIIDFSKQISISEKGDEIDAIAVGLNTMSEEMKAYIQNLKKSENIIKQKSEELALYNKELEQFAYVASHDLQEPLRIVTSYTQLLEKRYKNKLDSDADEFMMYIIEGTRRMSLLINDLLTYSRTGMKEKQFLEVDCNQVLFSAMQNLQESIRESHAKINFNNLPMITADALGMNQLFQNLLANAIKFRGEEIPEITVSYKEEAHQHLFAVKDNGIGIPAEYREKIFIIFQRLHGRDKYPGTGIGLAICKKIVEQHGGEIWVESTEGKGANFFFTLKK